MFTPLKILNRSQYLLSFCKKKVTKKNFSPFKFFRFLKPDAVTAPAARRAYPSPLKAARPSSDSLRSPTPGRLASRRSLLGNFLPALTSLTLVNRSLLAALTALYLLRESFKLLIVLNFLIVCHAQPYAFRLCRDTKRDGHPRLCRNIAAGRVPARALLTPRELIYSFLF